MYKEYLTKVVQATPWERAEAGEIDQYVSSFGFAFAENYSWGGTLQSVDVLFVLGGDIKNYQAFIVVDGKLEDLHQDHRVPYCLTCLNKEAESDKIHSANLSELNCNKYF